MLVAMARAAACAGWSPRWSWASSAPCSTDGSCWSRSIA